MSAALAIAQRELASFFRLPIGWVVIALYLVLTGLVFGMWTLRPGEPASMQTLFQLSGWLMIFVAPAISMRLVSEELRTGTIEPLMTAPVSDWQIVIGKYLGGVGFLLTMLAPTLLFVVILEVFSSPDYGPIVAGYAGLLALGMLYLAVGLLVSTLTSNQVVAFLGTLFFLLFMRIATTQGAAFLGPPLDRPLYALSVDLRMTDFARGVIDTGHLVFFLATSVWFTALAVVALESRRWR